MAVVQYCWVPGIKTSTSGWKAKHPSTVQATTEGGRWRKTVVNASGNDLTRDIYGEGDGKPLAGYKYSLHGVRVRRNTSGSGNIRIRIHEWAALGGNPGTQTVGTNYAEATITPNQASVGKWIALPNITIPANAVHWDTTNDLVGIWISANHDGGSAKFDYTVTGFNVYRSTQVPAGPTLTGTVTANKAYLTVGFVPNTGECWVETYLWDFGDGTATSSLEAPEHTYALPGTYNGTLTIDNSLQAAKVIPFTVVVTAPPSPPPNPAPAPSTLPSEEVVSDYGRISETLSLQVQTARPVNTIPLIDHPLNVAAAGYSTTPRGGWTPSQGGRIGVGPPRFSLVADGTGVPHYTYRDVPVIEGQWVGAAVTLSDDDALGAQQQADLRITFLDAADVALSTSGTEQTELVPTVKQRLSHVAQAPTNAVEARVVVRSGSTGAGAPGVAPNNMTTWMSEPVVNVEDRQAWAANADYTMSYPLPNLVQNPSGHKGAYGWETPTAESRLRGWVDPDGYTAGRMGLHFFAAIDTPNTFQTEPMPVDEGDTVKASWRLLYVGNYYRDHIEWLDADLVTISTTTDGTYRNSLGRITRATAVAPANAAYARLLFKPYADNAGNEFLAAGWQMAVTDVTVMASRDPAELSGSPLPVVDSASKWIDILGPTHELHITRNELDVGTLAATVLDPALDPAQTPDLQPGTGVRVQARNTDTGLWESLYDGRIVNAKATYVGGTRIYIEAADHIAALANATRPEGVGTIEELPYVLEGTGVPWDCNLISDHVSSAVVVAVNDSATALDQVAITRDSRRGFAWVDRNGVLVARDAALMPAHTAAVFDEDDYSDLDLDFDTDRAINDVRIKWLRYNEVTAETEEVSYGPYRDQDSIDTWGFHGAEFTMQGELESATLIEEAANEILAANATPVRRINSIQLPIVDSADYTPGKALLDLYDLVQITHADTDTDTVARVTSIEHDIAADVRRGQRWIMSVALGADGSVASPRSVPAPAAGGVNRFPYSYRKINAATIPHNTFTTLTSWTDEETDGVTFNGASGGYVVELEGRYALFANVAYAANATGRRNARLLVNGTGVVQAAGPALTQASAATYAICQREMRLAAGDEVLVQAFQDCGASLALSIGTDRSFFIMRRIGD